MSNVSVERVKAALLALSVAGCSHMSVVPRAADFLAAKRPARVWVTGPDNSEVLVTHPTVRADTLSGFSHDRYFEMPMADVKQMRASVPAVGRTLLVVGVGVAAVGVVVAQSHGQSTCSASPTTTPLTEDEIRPVC
jgi:hypothetical protein